MWIWEPLANTEFSMLQKQITDLNVTAQGITANVESLSTKVTNEYITEVDAKALISLTADGIKEDISKSYSTKDELSTFKTEINKTAEGIEAQISEVNEALDGANEAYITQGKPELYNYPAYNWTDGPKVGDMLTEGVSFTYSDDSYRKHNRAIIYDETAGKTYRFVKKDGVWQFSDIGDTEFSFINKKVTELKATTDEVSASLSKFETKVGSTYITKVEAAASLKVTTDGIYENISKSYVTNENIKGYSTTEEMNTAISKSAEGIALNISKKYATNETVEELSTVINATAQGMDLKVSADKLITTINASAEMVKISSEKLELEGLVTIESLKSSGATEINGDNIKTGQIKALELIGCTMNGGAISIGGNNVIMNEAGIWVIGSGSAENPKFRVDNSGNMTLGGTAYMTNSVAITGALNVSGDMNATGELSASNINASGGTIGNWSIGDGAIANNGVVLGSDGNLTLAGDKNVISLANNAKFMPSALYVNQGGYSGTIPWWGVYKAAAQAVASDERIKQDIKILSDNAYEDFFNSLVAYTYRFKEGSGFKTDKTHAGFISQYVKENLDSVGLPDLAVYDDDNPDLLGIDKQELIALCVWQIQKLKKRTSLLESVINGKVGTA